MPVFLLDVNMLLAMAWQQHAQHRNALAWLQANISPANPWATCSVTELGFVRISSNPKFLSNAASPRHAIHMLQTMTSASNHIFWASDFSLCDAAFVPRDRLRGHNQLTDAYLLAMALQKNGHLVTFDTGVLSLAHGDHERQRIIVVSP